MTGRRQDGFRPKAPAKYTTLSGLIDHLKGDYKPKCIQPGEDRDKAMHYSGQYDLAQKIIRLCSPED